ncbi:four helix bundle protein [Marinifilum sp. D737]|uniref:four helix bundle protein n=1 Tax=Marinifilum sp. D737 TaxID=2969628 RepID=UPI00227542BB|nr:four helix bundle protein [Marinifilum sp. D737]MCY1635018.1 four helix bundle protein [Marinifilum sp. D737]
MATVKYFEDLMIWQESRKLVNDIYNQFKICRDYGFKDQIQRAAVSVMNNIAEGFERKSNSEFKRFLDIAKSSCGEVRSMLYLAEDMEYIEKENAEALRNECKLLAGSIVKLKKSMNY